MRIWIACAIFVFAFGKILCLLDAQKIDVERVYAPRAMKFEVQWLSGGSAWVKATDASTGEVQVGLMQPCHDNAEQAVALNHN